LVNWLKQLIKRKERRPAQIQAARHYDLQYNNYRAEGLGALAQGRVKEAIDALGRAVLFRSDDPVAHLDLGRALQLDGKTEAARQAYLRALNLNPNLSEAKNALLALPPLPPTRKDFHPEQRIKVDGQSMTFRVLEVRKGGFGAVYVVIDEEFKARWALKTFQARYLWNDEDRKRFEREALTWLMLDRHPNIVTAKRLMLIEGFPCVLLDYHPHNLAEYLQTGPLGTQLAMYFAFQFCDGMFYAHQKMGIVHRDIKPSNCLLTEEKVSGQDIPVLKVTDFGLARTFAEAQERSLGLSEFEPEVRSQFTTVLGTPQYMSPEQFRAGAVLDTRSDIYSFGIMFYEMLTRDLPPVGFLAYSHIAKRASSGDFPESLKQIILRCVQLDPRERPRDFGELRNQLDAAHEQLTGFAHLLDVNPKALEMDSDDWNDKAIGLKNLGYLEEACTCCVRALDLSPNDAAVWSNYGGAQAGLGRFSEALSCFEKALKIESSNAVLWANKGAALDALSRHDEARTCYERAIEIEPGYEVAWANLGANLTDAGYLESAVSCFDLSLKINRRDFEVWSNKAKILYRLGRYEEALVSCGEGLAIQPRHPGLWNTRACILLKLERLEDALLASNRGLEVDENDPYVWQTKGAILSHLEKPIEAEKCFERARELRNSSH